MKVRDIMTQPPQTCTLSTTLGEASRRMKAAGCGMLVVLDRHARTAGILTDRDLAMAVGDEDRNVAQLHVAEVMSGGVHSCQPHDDLLEVVRRMGALKVRRLPVINQDGDVKGVLSVDDIILWGLAEGEIPADAVIPALRALCAAHWPVH
jgi:signal-transduction protein with cAMP-binding, CBS, and nucleotidyltransferase domain